LGGSVSLASDEVDLLSLTQNQVQSFSSYSDCGVANSKINRGNETEPNEYPWIFGIPWINALYQNIGHEMLHPSDQYQNIRIQE
jgi:hypothetical protein